MPKPQPYTAKDGTTTYRVRFRHNGTQSSETFTTHRRAQWFCEQIAEHDSRFALRALADLEDELSGPDTEDDSPTLDTVAAEFLEWKADYVRTDETIEQYRQRYNTHVSPTLGSKPVNSITPDDVEAWGELMARGKIKNTRSGKRLSNKTIRDCHFILHSIMEYACSPRRRYSDVNPCKGSITLPKTIRGVPKGMMPMQWQALHQALLELGYDDAADLTTFLIGSGWRIGEAIALPVANVEDYGESAPMYVTMNQVMRGKTIVPTEGKAQKSMRRIQIDPDTAAVVRACCQGKAHNDLVFQWKGKYPWYTHRFRDRLDKAARRAGLPHITSHWFRHTHVAWMAMSGAPLPELQNRIGHADISTTLGVYGSMIGDVKTDTIATFMTMRDATPAVTASSPAKVIEGSTIPS